MTLTLNRLVLWNWIRRLENMQVKLHAAAIDRPTTALVQAIDQAQALRGTLTQIYHDSSTRGDA